MANQPPLGTTTSQTAKKPKNINFRQMYNMAAGTPLPYSNAPIAGFLNPAASQDVPLPPPMSDIGPSPILGPPAPKPDYVDRSAPKETPDSEKTVAQLIADYNRRAAEVGLKPLPPALPSLVLPDNPSRDVRAEGRDRMGQMGLANFLPLLSLLTTGGIGTGLDLVPTATTAIAQGAERFQDKAWQADSENYKETIQKILNQRAIDENTRNQEVGIVNAENQIQNQIRDDQLSGIRTLIQYKLGEERMRNEEKKLLATERNNILRMIQRAPASQQEAIWKQYQDRWDELGLRPMYDETGRYIPLTHSTDVIGYANAKTAEERLKFMRDAFGVKEDQWQKTHELNVKKAKDAVELRKLEIQARKDIAALSRESAWNRMVYRENAINARWNDSADLKKMSFLMTWKMKLDSPGGVKINQLYDRAEGLRLHRRSLQAAEQAVLKDRIKYKKADREALLKNYREQIAAIDPLIQDAEKRITILEDQRDSGFMTEEFVDAMVPDSMRGTYYEIFPGDRKKDAGDSGATVGTKSGEGVNRRKYEPGFGGKSPSPTNKSLNRQTNRGATPPARKKPQAARPPQGTIRGRGTKSGVPYVAEPIP